VLGVRAQGSQGELRT